MAKWNSLTPHWDQQPTTPVIRATVSAMEVVLALVKQMASGLGAHPLVNVSILVTIANKTAYWYSVVT